MFFDIDTKINVDNMFIAYTPFRLISSIQPS